MHLFVINNALRGKKPAFSPCWSEKQVLRYRCSFFSITMSSEIGNNYIFMLCKNLSSIWILAVHLCLILQDVVSRVVTYNKGYATCYFKTNYPFLHNILWFYSRKIGQKDIICKIIIGGIGCRSVGNTGVRRIIHLFASFYFFLLAFQRGHVYRRSESWKTRDSWSVS